VYCTSISPQFPVFLPRKRAACAARSLFKRLWLLPSHRSAVRAPTEEGPSRPTSEQDLPQSAVDISLATDRAKPFQGGHGSGLSHSGPSCAVVSSNDSCESRHATPMMCRATCCTRFRRCLIAVDGGHGANSIRGWSLSSHREDCT
jgi:hypothetical protein